MLDLKRAYESLIIFFYTPFANWAIQIPIDAGLQNRQGIPIFMKKYGLKLSRVWRWYITKNEVFGVIWKQRCRSWLSNQENTTYNQQKRTIHLTKVRSRFFAFFDISAMLDLEIRPILQSTDWAPPQNGRGLFTLQTHFFFHLSCQIFYDFW